MANEFTIIDSFQVTTADEVQAAYVASANTRILNFTVTNNYGSNQTYKAYIYDADDTTAQATTPLKIVVWDSYDLSPPLIGHVVPAGGSIRVECSAAESLVFRATGRLV